MATNYGTRHPSRTVLWCRSFWAGLLVYSGIFWMRRLLQRPRLLVLAYHRVSPAEQAHDWDDPRRHVSTETFEKQLLALRRYYRFVSLDELRAYVAGEKRLHRHVALVTLDDGYRDNFEEALPVLVRHGIPATFFLSLGFVGDRRSFWFDRLAEACRDWERGEQERARLRSLLPAPLAKLLAETNVPWAERLQRVVRFVARLPLLERRALLKRLLPAPATAEHLASQAMTWTEIRQLREHGMSIGAHGLTHTPLTRLPAADARREVHDSLAGVRYGSGAEVTAFAYPSGAVDAEVARTVREAGVQIAFTLEPRENRPGEELLLLGRHSVCEATSAGPDGGFSAATFVCKMAGILPRLLPAETDADQADALELAWTGPQEARAHRDPLLGLPALHTPAPGGRSSEPPPRRSDR